MYKRLGVTFDHTLGESFYEDRLAAIVEELLRRGIARESDGAVCVFLDGIETPMIVRKKDGAFLYGTTDLATIRYRMETWRPDAILYVVDHRQSLHFKQLFAAARLLGYDNVELQHVSFGTVLGDDGRPFKTRSGEPSASKVCSTKPSAARSKSFRPTTTPSPTGPSFPTQQRRQIAESVGIAALKYADLSQNRTSDYVFSYDKMLAMNGNTATYMQYAYARVRSIFAKGDVDAAALRAAGAPILLRLAGRKGVGRRIAPLFRGPRHDGGRLSPEPTHVVSIRLGQSLLDVFRAVPRSSRRERRTSPEPPAAVRSHRPNDPKGAGVVGDRGGREDVGGRGEGREERKRKFRLCVAMREEFCFSV